MFQSTRPRGARLCQRAAYRPLGGGFNPRAPAGRDPDELIASVVARVFQSTRPRGARRSTNRMTWCPLSVSIHAPARGATAADRAEGRHRVRFNPRARAGRDSSRSRRRSSPRTFQSTRPRGARLGEVGGCCTACEFQSTRPRGARPPRARDGDGGRLVSIHAPARGATWPWTFLRLRWASFNPRARAGRDPLSLVVNVTDALVSIHAPARGAT